MAEQRIAAIYTGAALVKPLSDLLKETLPGCKVMNILDDSMIAEIIETGYLTKAVKRRLYGYYEIACASGAELILNTCSSIGDAVYGAREFFPIPIVCTFSAITSGDVQTHNRLIAETAKQVSDRCEVILLAQGSMARMEEPGPLCPLQGSQLPRLICRTG